MAYLAPSLARLRSQTNATFPNRSKASDGWLGDAAHQARVSDHNPDPKTGVVRALDLTVTKAQAQRVIEAATGDPRVAYVIYDRQIWTPGRGRHAYKGSNPHSNHVHVSLKHTSEAENTLDNWKGLDMPGMCSPIHGSVSSEYGNRNGFLHAGIDIATGGVQRVVYAAYAGTLSHIVRGRKHKQPATQGTVVAPGRSGNGGRVNNPDGETQVYIHVTFDAKWENGMKVEKGERLGVIDMSGNTTGLHLHFETWNKNGTVRNPRLDFAYHGVRPGEKPKAAPAPKPAPKPTPAPKPVKEWPNVKLLEDGKFQTLSKKAYQRLLAPASVGDYKGLIDGVFEEMSVKAEQRWLKSLDYYKGLVDGKREQMTIKGLQSLLYDRGFYRNGNATKKQMVDGKFQRLSVIGLQKLINSQTPYYK